MPDPAKAIEFPTVLPDVPRETLDAFMQAQALRPRVHKRTDEDGKVWWTGTPEQLVADCAYATVNGLNHYEHKHEAKWQCADTATAIWLAMNGWQEGRTFVDGIFARVTAKHTQSIIPTLAYSDEPDGDVDVERWMAGEDECFLVETQGAVHVSVAGSYVTLAVDGFVSCGDDSADVLKKGAYLGTLVYLLERAGYRTCLVYRYPNVNLGKHGPDGMFEKQEVDLILKEFGQVLDVPRVIFWLAHPASVRAILLGALAPYRTDNVGSHPTKYTGRPGVLDIERADVNDLEGWLARSLKTCGLSLEEAR